MRILINIPFLHLQGGVANHYLGLKPYWKLKVRYNQIGKRSEIGFGKGWLFIDLIKYIVQILFWKPDLILLNPSLARNAVRRDLLYLKVGKIFNKKIVFFIHGWDNNYAKELDRKKISKALNSIDAVIVLAKEFKRQLVSWGVTTKIYMSSTKVDDRMLSDFNIKSRTGEVKTLLFLSRIEFEKGILISLDIYSILKNEFPYLKLRIVGDGPFIKESIKYVEDNKIQDVSFVGVKNGKALSEEFSNSELYLLPTFYGEGMPTSLLEAMAFGMPVVTRPVGGIKDFFENHKMGLIFESKNAHDYVIEIKQLISNLEVCREIAGFNYNFVQENFLASKVCERLENILNGI